MNDIKTTAKNRQLNLSFAVNPSSGKPWNTAIFTDPPKQEPAQDFNDARKSIFERDVIIHASPTFDELYESYVAHEHKSCRTLDRNSKAYTELRQLLDEVAKALQVDPATVRFDIIQTPQINAWVIKGEKNDFSHIFITTSLIQLLSDENGRTRAGQIAAVFGHELGHVIEGHYDTVKSTPKPQSEDPIEIEVEGLEYLKNAALRGLERQAFSRNQEFQADEHGIRALMALGFAPDESIRVLESLKSTSKKPDWDQHRLTRKNKAKLWIAEKLLMTHPELDGRIARCQGVIHQLTIDAIGKRGSEALSQPAREDHLELGDLPKSSPLQEKLTVLQEIAAEARETRTISSEKLALLIPQAPTPGDRNAFESFMTEARHLYLLAPMLLRHALECVPYLPWDQLAEKPSDRPLPIGHLMESSSANALTSFTDALYKAVDHACQIEIRHRKNDLRGQAEVLVDRWMGIESVYRGSPARPTEIEQELKKLFKKDRGLLLQVLSERGVLHYDTSAIDLKVFDDMEEEGSKSPLSKRAARLTDLLESERKYLKVPLVERLIKDDSLDGAKRSNVAAFAKQLNRMFQELTVSLGSALEQGEQIGMWAMDAFGAPNTPKRVSNWQAFIKELSEVESASISRPECNPVVIGCLKVLLPEDFKARHNSPAVTLQEFLNHLDGLIEPGINRDCLLLSQLVELHPTLKEGIIAGRSDLDAKYPTDKSWFAELTSLIHKLDLSWYTLTLRRSQSLTPTTNLTDDGLRDFTDMPINYLDNESELPPELLRFYLNAQIVCAGPRTAAGSALRQIMSWASTQFSWPISNEEAFGLLMQKEGNSPFSLGYAEFNDISLFGESENASFPPSGHTMSEIPVTSALMRALVLDGQGLELNIHDSKSQAEVLSQYFSRIPQGEFRDYAILSLLAAEACSRGLAAEIERTGRFAGHTEKVQRKLGMLKLGQIDLREGQKSRLLERNDVEGLERDTCLKLLELLSPHNTHTNIGKVLPVAEVASVEALRRVYTSQSEFIRMQLGVSAFDRNTRNLNLPVSELPAIATLTAKVLFKSFESYESEKADMSSEERLDVIRSYFIYPSETRDALLKEVLADAWVQANAQQGESPLTSGIAEQIYALYLAPHLKHSLGRELYQQWQTSPAAENASFDVQMEKLKRYHEPGTVSYEVALKTFVDGGLLSTGNSMQAQVRKWAEYDSLVASLKEGEVARSTDFRRMGAFQLIQELLQEDCVPAQDKAATLLWLAGLRTSSHLVDCYEVVYKVKPDTLKEEAELLTEAEKRQLLQEVLGGQHGILRDTESARKDFLNALFAGVFGQQNLAQNDRRSFKAVFDALLHYSPPERAAVYLASFLVSHLEGRSFNEQVKLFFASFGFVGPKTAQNLATRTNLLSPELRAQLMDLTSRVPGPDKRVIYETLESVMGSDARQAVHSIGDHLGGGSLMMFYEVTLWNENGSGPGRQGVVGLLRPDIVHALPEDLLIVRRILEGMRDAPEYFAGKVVSSGLMDNLIWQSVVETNLERTAQIQKQMRDDLLSFTPTNSDVSVTIPEVWSTSSHNGQTIKLTRGPLIFMERGKGVTLDRFLEGKAENDPQTQKVLYALSEALAFQLREGSCVHCDLHHGNVLVTEEAGTLGITILDVGLSVELNPEVSKNLCSIAKLFVPKEGMLPSEAESSQIKSRLLDNETIHWLEKFVDALGQRHGVTIEPAARERTLRSLAGFLTTDGISIQERITGVTSEIEKLGFTLPGDYYYLTRGLAVSSYIWANDQSGSQAGSRQALILRALTERDTQLPDFGAINIAQVVRRAESIVRELGGTLHNQEAHALLTRMQQANGIFEVISMLDELPSVISGVDVDSILQRLAGDKDFFKLLGIEELRAFLGLGDSAESQPSPHNRFMQLAEKLITIETRPLGAAKVEAERENWGHRPRVWSKLPPPGSVIKVIRRGSEELFQVGLYNPSTTSGDDIPLLKPVSKKPINFADTISKIRAAGSHNSFRSSPSESSSDYESFDSRFEFYKKMLDSLEKPSLYDLEVLTLGAQISAGGEIIVYPKDNETPIEQFWYDRGESLQNYLRELTLSQSELAEKIG
jgi:hypothetical protein